MQINPALKPRRLPIQKRAVERTRLILDTTARLLEEVGIDDLTTVRIAKEMGISVGSLYHYYPNKHAILHDLGAQWLDEMTLALEDIDNFNYDALSLRDFVESSVDRMLTVYENQRAILPLMQALSSIPELRNLDQQHDEMVISKLVVMFKRVGIARAPKELNRIAWAYLEMTHAVFLLAMEQSKQPAAKTVIDIKRMGYELLQPLGVDKRSRGGSK